MAAVMSSGRSTGRGPWLPQEHHPGLQRGLPQQQGGSVTLAAEERAAPAWITILASRSSFDPFCAVRNEIATPLRCGGFPGIQGHGSITAEPCPCGGDL